MDHRDLSGGEGSRTPDPDNAIVVLYQLSYTPAQVTIFTALILVPISVCNPLLMSYAVRGFPDSIRNYLKNVKRAVGMPDIC